MSRSIPSENIQVDTSDEDSLFDRQSVVDSNLSLASSVRDYCYENGRRYHAYRHGQYPIPNDEEEQDRLEFLHHFFKLLTGGDLYRAPVAQGRAPARILDLGTGTGDWALEMAEDFPGAEIVGTDLSPIQPNWAPPNCRFFIDDVESDWTFTQDEAFDYIHARALAGGIADWERLLRQAFSHLRPGGWIELQEYETRFTSDDGTHEQVPTFNDWQERLDEASKQFGKRMNIAPELGRLMAEAGFVDVMDDIYKSPMGSWPKNPHLKDVGKVAKLTVLEAIEPYSLALFTRVLGHTYEETQEFMLKVQDDLMDSRHHVYGRVHYVYGRRPADG
ncbi:Methyltransferase [Aspergillus sp. HF37]|nr:Methyltransferase [Aspergillus sp. HF37]